MRNNQIIPMVLHGFKNIANFSGRDPRIKFWPYFGCLYLMSQAISIIAFMPFFLETFKMMGQQSEPIDIAAFGAIMKLSALTSIAFIALLAAAVTRRLHDRNLRGYWALIPVAFLILAFWKMGPFLEVVANPDILQNELNPSDILAFTLLNLVYLISVIALMIILGLKGHATENRFGPPVIVE
jgi:uncharacterized membrane protein YhaH (DUF805 family)